MRRYWVGGGGLFGGRDNRLCCLWYSIGLEVRGLWISTSLLVSYIYTYAKFS